MAGEQVTPVEMIRRLVAFDTVSSESNLALIDHVAEFLAGHGIDCRRTYDETGRKANLFATIGPERPGGVVLSGHTDVVPVAGQDWETDPFTLSQRDGRLYGRGAADMKSFIALALAMVPAFKEKPLETPIHLAFSYDEEVGCRGVGRLIDDVVANLPRPRMVIVGEPTSMQVVTAQKSCLVFRTRIKGRNAHSSQTDRGANAVIAAARLIGLLAELAEEKKAQAPAGSRFDPPYTTIHVGTIQGGTAGNIIPDDCSFDWEIRGLPGESGEPVLDRLHQFAETRVLPPMRVVAPEAGVETERLAVVPSLMVEEGAPAERLVTLLTGANDTAAISYGSEAGLFQAAGMSTVVCGPGSIDQAHKPDEFIALDQVEACAAFLRKLAQWAQGKPPDVL
ncbi:MAG: acetylornithine deacetylase [Kiloniellales bacterium]